MSYYATCFPHITNYFLFWLLNCIGKNEHFICINFLFRHTNHRPVKLIKNGKEKKTTAERICVGDIILLTDGDIVPCDAVVLSTSHDSHQVKYEY